MALRLLRVALTGGIATGKSYCLARFAALGVPVLDADVLAHAALDPGTPGLAAVAHRFGPAIVGPSGRLDRAALAHIVFNDAAARRDLEAIVHPAVFAAVEGWFEREARAFADHGRDSAAGPMAGFGIADIPLLYETSHDADFDRVIVVACDAETQLARLVARDGLAEAEARTRIASQAPIDEKRRRANYVIDTTGTLAETDAQVVELWERLRAEARPSGGRAFRPGGSGGAGAPPSET